MINMTARYRFRQLCATARQLIYFASLVFLAACANIVSPTGGPKDTTPPQVIATSPPSGTTRFSEHSFSLRFDEFIQTGNLQQQLLVSPPLTNNPTLKLKGKTLIISFKDTLLPNATYAFYFGESIKDITEGNLMPPYTYFFSTGDSIDQQVLRGKVFNAFDGKVAENLLVMLFALPMADSAFALEFPRYITRPDKSGTFEFRHLAAGEYHLAALSDLNNNMRYDLITEGVAFHTLPVTPWPDQPLIAPQDSTSNDSLAGLPGASDTLLIEVPADTAEWQLITDTAQTGTPSPFLAKTPEIVLRMFVGEDSIQKVLAARSEGRNKAFVAMRYPLKEPQINILPPLHDTMVRWVTNETTDTLIFWLSAHPHDSLVIEVVSGGDSRDTIYIPLREPPVSPRGRVQAPQLTFQMNVPRNGKLRPGIQPEVTFSIPLRAYDFSNATISSPDTSFPLDLTPKAAGILRDFLIGNQLETGIRYEISIPPGAAGSWDGTAQDDTLTWSFTPEAADQFGTLTVVPLTRDGLSGTILLMLTDEKMRVLETRTLTKPYAKQTFSHLLPAKYSLMAVDDRNGNGRWDTGDYWKRIQPEEILRLPNPVNIRANWEEELEWKLEFKVR